MRERYKITTPENVEFEFELAGFFSRLSAWLLDVLALIFCTILLGALVSVLAPLGQVQMAVHAALYFVLNWGYFVFFEWYWGGQSLGKRAMGLRVLSDDGVRISLLQSAVRNLFRVLDSIPIIYLIGGTAAFFSPQGKRLGDMAAGTVVVQERELPLPGAIISTRERHNTFVEDPDAARRIVTGVTLEERELLLDLALRRERLPLARRLQLFEELAEHLEEKLRLGRPAYFSAERYCLNVAAVLLRGG